MNLLFRGGRVIDPATSTDAELDLLVQDGRVAGLGRGVQAPAGTREISVAGKLVVPGLVDLHVHLREPGQEHKEDIASGTRAAAAGGFTWVCCMANTAPVNDCGAVTERILRRAREVGHARVRPVGAITAGLAGQELAALAEMRAAGIVAISDDGRAVMDAAVMRSALAGARDVGVPVVQHAEDAHLAAAGVISDGPVAARLGMPGRPASAETTILARDLELVAEIGARYHAQHLSARRSVELLRAAKRRGLPVTCEATPHHLTLTDDACAGLDPSTRVNPPLRNAADREALWEGLADGTIDAVATDHAPHAPAEKGPAYAAAAPGMIGLETAVGLVLRLVGAGVISLARAVELMTIGPARAFGLDGEGAGKLVPGGPADVTVIDPDRAWTVTGERLRSRSRNTPFLGWELRGKAVLTLMAGRVTHDEDGALAPG